MPAFQLNLLQWYDENARELPWRSDPKPYKVWLSEIMLQQTRVETVLPYFERFLERFPDIGSLASASQEEVLRLWEGLGYYSRARNLHKAAQVVMSDLSGQLPASAASLEKLPGIGKYCAAAIASIAYGEPAAAVDGNIKRIYARLLNLQEALGSSGFEQKVQSYAQEVLPKNRPGDFTQALMDLGSLLCLPKQPQCQVCPISASCLAYQHNTQNSLPFRVKKAPLPHYTVCAAVIIKAGQVLLKQREQQGMLGGLWEYPGGKIENSDQDLTDCLRRELEQKTGLKIAVGEKIGLFPHSYTHFKISLHSFYCDTNKALPAVLPRNFTWVPLEDLKDHPMGKVARQITDLITK